jgi:hypothetical protein
MFARGTSERIEDPSAGCAADTHQPSQAAMAASQFVISAGVSACAYSLRFAESQSREESAPMRGE